MPYKLRLSLSALMPRPSNGEQGHIMGFTQRLIAVISNCSLYLAIKSGGFHIMCLKVKDRFAPILSQTLGLNIESTQTALKSGINFFIFQKTLKTKGEVDVKTIFNH